MSKYIVFGLLFSNFFIKNTMNQEEQNYTITKDSLVFYFFIIFYECRLS